MKRISLAALALTTLAAAPALADRGPTQPEATAITATLAAAGFKSWNKIEYDPDGPKWKVDDARALNGKTYDLQLDANTYAIVKKDGD
ncbi:hypothetical protein ASE00_04960 [Sphingomonas sp. Root710]|uniref:PepSY domain-containing protein n=1 Tax=Sphingomonas sp. Root710 TaxID=1736594 RepID=UPI00070190C6|nr:PepSY domain-containing protein [Sphingomonas sp. Root710]KRB86092.1 hypothetical protein ASE00_04960 [Sphingomonas sp. Root710]